jgi:hypothetical protein
MVMFFAAVHNRAKIWSSGGPVWRFRRWVMLTMFAYHGRGLIVSDSGDQSNHRCFFRKLLVNWLWYLLAKQLEHPAAGVADSLLSAACTIVGMCIQGMVVPTLQTTFEATCLSTCWSTPSSTQI